MAKPLSKRGRLEEMAKDVETLAYLLNAEAFSRDVGELYRIAASIRACGRAGDGRYSYSGVLPLTVPLPKKVRPKHIRQVDLELGIQVSGTLSDTDKPEAIADPLTSLSVQIVLQGWGELAKETHYCTLHIDRHEDDTGDDENADADDEADSDNGAGEPDDCHPRYHIQFGGRRLRAAVSEGNYGGLFFGEAPRVAMPPLDAVLAIDFAISNFNGPALRRLREKPEYLRAVARSQAELWTPYVTALHRAWSRDGREAWSFEEIWPSLTVDP